MYHKLVALLGEKFPQVRKDGISVLARSLAIQVTDETQAQALVEQFSAEKVTEFIKEWRKEADQEISKSTKTFEENLKSKFNLTPKTQEPAPTTEPNDLASQIAKAIKDAVTPLQTELQALKSGNVAQSRKTSFENALKDVPPSLKNSYLKTFEKMNFENDDDFNAFLTETQTDLKQLTQELNNKGLGGFPRPEQPSAQVQKQVTEDIKAWAEKK